MSSAAAIDDLIAKEEIRQAMARYSRGIDRRDEELVRSAYHEDSFDNHGFGFQASGWDLAAAVRPDGNGFPLEWKQTTHFLGQHLIEVDGDEATSEVYFLAFTRLEDDDGLEWDQVASGRYVDRWERRDGEFKIAERTVIYDRSRTDALPTIWPGPDHDVPKVKIGGDALDTEGTAFGEPGPNDPSYDLLR
jgi:hypothetical protein